MSESFASRLGRVRTWYELDGDELSAELGEVPLRVRVAATDASRARGLAGAEPLDDGHGVLFLHPAGRDETYWMKGMTFPIDIVWIDGDRVVEVTSAAPPVPGDSSDELLPRHRIRRRSDKVVEVQVGWAAAHELGRGSCFRLI